MDVRFEATDGTDLEGVVLEASVDGDHARRGVAVAGGAERSEHARRGVAIVCHPHPQFGGSMDTWMPPVLQRALAEDGWMALRFNFRGVDLSEGRFEGGHGEVEDVLGAVEFLLGHVDDAEAPVFVTGWSFGALVGLAASLRDERVVGWAGVAPPVGLLGSDGREDIALPTLDREALAGWERPSCWIIGSRDQFSSVDDVRSAAEAAGDRATIEVLDGDHFLLGRGDDLSRLVTAHARHCLDQR